MTRINLGLVRKRERHVEPAPVWSPFFTRGNTWRNEIKLDLRGWYFVDDRSVLSGPHTTKLDCEHALECARATP